MTTQTLRTRSFSVQATSNTAIFYVLTGWMPTILISRLRAVVALANRSANLQIQLAIQTAATDPESANTPVALGSVINTVGRTFVDVDVTQAGNGNVNTAMWFRLGVLASSTGATVESGTGSLTPSFRP